MLPHDSAKEKCLRSSVDGNLPVTETARSNKQTIPDDYSTEMPLDDPEYDGRALESSVANDGYAFFSWCSILQLHF